MDGFAPGLVVAASCGGHGDVFMLYQTVGQCNRAMCKTSALDGAVVLVLTAPAVKVVVLVFAWWCVESVSPEFSMLRVRMSKRMITMNIILLG